MEIKELEATFKFTATDLDCLTALSNNSGVTLRRTFDNVLSASFVSESDKLQYFKDTFYENGVVKNNNQFSTDDATNIIVKFIDEVSKDSGIRRYILFLFNLGDAMDRFDMGYLQIKPSEITRRSILQTLIDSFDGQYNIAQERENKPKDEPIVKPADGAKKSGK